MSLQLNVAIPLDLVLGGGHGRICNPQVTRVRNYSLQAPLFKDKPSEIHKTQSMLSRNLQCLWRERWTNKSNPGKVAGGNIAVHKFPKEYPATSEGAVSWNLSEI